MFPPLRYAAILIFALAFAVPLMAATITVNSSGDAAGGDGQVTLREAILSINNRADLNSDVALMRTGGGYGDQDTIQFLIGSGAQTIALASSLPPLKRTALIDGTTQPGFAGTPLITISPVAAGSLLDGLVISSLTGSTVQAIQVQNFGGTGIKVVEVVADIGTLSASADNTMFEESPTFSNGAGENLFAGKTAGFGVPVTLSRRALVRFNLSSLPAGTVVTSAKLRLTVSKEPLGAPDVTFDLHRVQAQWGEGTSNVPFNEGRGVPATPNDATWTYRLYNTATWTTPGGDYVGTASAGTLVTGLGTFDWGSTTTTVADVQGWIDNPATNFGWLLRAQTESLNSAKQFVSRENAAAANRPQLILEYIPVPNDAPIAESDSYVAFQNTKLIVPPPGVMANDHDPEGDSFSSTLVSGATHGSVVLSLDGSFNYTPAAGYTGPDSFTYKINDGHADSNIATVWLNVSPVGSSTTALTYTRFEQPCRIIDTRLAGGQLDGIPRNFRVAGNSGFTTQGGTAAGCGVPSTDVTSVFINFVAVNPSGAGNLRASAWPKPLPVTGSIINYQSLNALNLANGLAFPICDSSADDCSEADITVQANGGSTHLVADVLGYFSRFPREEGRTSAVTVRQADGRAIGATCTNLTSIAVNAPLDGEVTIRAGVVIQVPHVAGTSDAVLASINAAAGTCQGLAELGESGRSWIDASLPAGTYYPLISIRRTFPVTAGTHTFYVNGLISSGASTQTLHSVGVDASFHPD